MQPASRANAAIRDYAGLVTNSGPVASDPSAGEADEQVNLMPFRPGEMVVRPGYRVVRFDEESAC